LELNLKQAFGKKFPEKCFDPECFFKNLAFPTASISGWSIWGFENYRYVSHLWEKCRRPGNFPKWPHSARLIYYFYF